MAHMEQRFATMVAEHAKNFEQRFATMEIEHTKKYNMLVSMIQKVNPEIQEPFDIDGIGLNTEPSGVGIEGKVNGV
ncbi:hypothetical protein TSUD_15380 [Trifolium subterraneum]|uniref:Uncharacterized protein n=1 Tax=Trifolium subterraneum TaxID=3900 RepID=A0A2Z6N1H8_TRISU|nr:hypothetical protein TSUD_15380 [Trifolium subterraneum]